MFAIRARRKSVSEKDFLDSINKVWITIAKQVQLQIAISTIESND
jgi:ATP-dependent 26S proteasome regulatory subunit